MATAVTTMAAQHAAGIFANRNLDGPEIGTLVVVVDRAKNLPNLRTMGKQNPYCAARLGKMALKTETDHRGGQTPKWDQELRFTVHESNDYQKLKLSIFNEDKRTDLIGETFIDIDDVLRRGGGQQDSWHELHSKGKYAGQVRIELTFYDCRPRDDKPPSQEQTAFSPAASRDSPRQIGGARELPSKRHQSDMGAHADQSPNHNLQNLPIPTPRQAPRSFHTPPRMGSMADLRSAESEQPQQSHQHDSHQWTHPDEDTDYPQTYTQAHANFSGYNDAPEDASFQYPDDPYALQTAHVDEEHDPESQPGYTPYRNDRVQQLSGSPRAIPHSHSAPSVYSREQAPAAPRPAAQPAPNPYSTSYDHFTPGSPHDGYDHEYTRSAAAPPPPPSHRNSVPAPRTRVPYQTTPHRPLAQHQSHSDPYHFQQHSRPSGEHQSWEGAYEQPRRRSTNVYEGEYGPTDQRQDSVDRQDLYPTQPPPHWQQPANFQAQPQYYRGTRMPPHDQTPQHTSSGNGPQVVRPRAISPSAVPQRPAIKRKSLNAGANAQSTPFSPDSFDTYNPNATSAAASPISDSRTRDPEPMYTHQHTESSPSTFQRQGSGSVPVPEPEGPIRDAHGRVIDPSDHLPPSTHAPEPEKKGADKHRATITATVKTRFGPRDARPAQITPTRTANYGAPVHTPSPLSLASTPRTTADHSAAPSPSQQREAMAAAARQRLQARNNAPPYGGGSSPLAPTAPGALNQSAAAAAAGMRSDGYHTHAGPPPVPMKIPLDHEDTYSPSAPGPGPDAGLSHDLSRLDLRSSPLQSLEARYGGTGGQRTRRSRFGA